MSSEPVINLTANEFWHLLDELYHGTYKQLKQFLQSHPDYLNGYICVPSNYIAKMHISRFILTKILSEQSVDVAIERLEIFLECGVNMNNIYVWYLLITMFSSSFYHDHGYNQFFEHIVSTMVRYGVDINQIGENRKCPLSILMEGFNIGNCRGHISMLQILIDNGADPKFLFDGEVEIDLEQIEKICTFYPKIGELLNPGGAATKSAKK